MSVAELFADLTRLNVRLEAHGDRLRFSPRSAVTPDLLARLKTHRADLLAMLRPAPEVAPINRADAVAVWQAALDRLEGDTLFTPDELEALRAADVQWANDPEPEDNQIEVIDPPDPCPECGTLEMWQTMVGNWRCLRCDPPTTARRQWEANNGGTCA